MFTSFDTVKFGAYLRSLRNSLKYSQADVKNKIGINTDTLRKIEAGLVVPRYDTLDLLSYVYKKDLLNELLAYRNSNLYFQYYSRLDDLIFNYDIDKLNDLESDFIEFTSNKKDPELVNVVVESQFKLVLKGISEFYKGNSQHAKDTFIESLRLGIPDFEVINHRHYKYTFFETRILFLLGISLSENNEPALSDSMLIHCLDMSNFDPQATFSEKLMITKIYFNLAYNGHKVDNQEMAIMYADKGIQFCLDNHINYSLAGLLYRKGVALISLDDDEGKEHIRNSIALLRICSQDDLADQYEKIAIEYYNLNEQA
ncbi:transcriptional regulator [Acidaminobacter sp. JC074]|uniref:helix-turn-helix domain-containing protein n=1 Tax=Acidaminobacter sp. JC074 TaxID=2530199 RepID=UPI001F0F3E61|nr:helix-turn-helix domain-containing protein [Acidaminobacter sp. JC074]MCH4886564.1 transcriptional regulator [Acidaminobacter sp. JC074]